MRHHYLTSYLSVLSDVFSGKSPFSNEVNPMGNNRHKAPYSVYECDLLMKIGSIILQQKKEVVFSEIENVVIDGGGTIERMFGNRTRDSIERKARDLLQLPKN